MQQIEVFADVACPFAHAGLRRFTAYRRNRGGTGPALRVRAWPLERVNGKPHAGHHLAPEIEALRSAAAPDLFTGFEADGFPTTTLATLAAEAAAYRAGPQHGEAFSLAVRDALWEHGLDVADPHVLHHLAGELDVPAATRADEEAVQADLVEGRQRGVTGSPHFFTEQGDFFCPTLDISKNGAQMEVSFDEDGFRNFVTAVFA